MRSFRFVHLGIAAALAAATATVVGLSGHLTAAPGDVSSVVPIVPCRLFDTRAANTVGTRSTPIGALEEATFAVWGTNGNCTIPTTATGIVSNLTTVNGTATSFLTVFPADASLPNASNLNWVAGDPPTPNQVSVGLSSRRQGQGVQRIRVGRRDLRHRELPGSWRWRHRTAGPSGPAGPRTRWTRRTRRTCRRGRCPGCRRAPGPPGTNATAGNWGVDEPQHDRITDCGAALGTVHARTDGRSG